jgi:hypothetical protein
MSESRAPPRHCRPRASLLRPFRLRLHSRLLHLAVPPVSPFDEVRGPIWPVCFHHRSPELGSTQVSCSAPHSSFLRAPASSHSGGAPASSSTMSCPRAAWPPCSSAAVCHAHQHACSGEPPGLAEAPVGVARCPEHARATCAADGLAAGENRPVEPLPCLGPID